MGNIRKKVLRVNAVYWSRTGSDQKARNTYGVAQQIKVRWTDYEEEMIMPLTGRKVTTKARLMLPFDVNVGDLVWKGVIADLPSTERVPTEAEGGYEILIARGIDDIRARPSKRLHLATV